MKTKKTGIFNRIIVGSVLLVSYSVINASANDKENMVDGIFTKSEWEVINTLSPLPEVTTDTTNAYVNDQQAASLGKKLFFDKRFSAAITVGPDIGKTGQVACATCHAAPWGQDNERASRGIIWTGRNTPPVVNFQFYDWFYWAGRADSGWQVVIGAASSVMGANRLRIAHGLYDYYKEEYNNIFKEYPLPEELNPNHKEASRFPKSGEPKQEGKEDGPWEFMSESDRRQVNRIAANYAKSVHAYMNLLVSRNAPFDQYVAGDKEAINDSAKNGLKLFIGKAKCVECHSGPAFTDNEFHNLGLKQEGLYIREKDYGHYEAVPILLTDIFGSDGEYSDDRNTNRLKGLKHTDAQIGQFRTKHLRQIGNTGPYMHTGNHKTLLETVEFYNRGGDESGFPGVKDELMTPLDLSKQEMSDLVAFMETLTGELIPEEIYPETN